MPTEQPSPERIFFAALELFLRQGVRKTSLEEVALQAGVTRVTVYRHYVDKRGLVQAVCRRIAAIFEKAAQESRGRSVSEIDACLNRLGMELRALPEGNLLARFEEIRCLYPETYEEFRSARETAIDTLFEQALAAAKRERVLRKGLHQEVLRAIFRSAVVRLIENPELISASVPLSDVVATVTMVFRHGILKEKRGEE